MTTGAPSCGSVWHWNVNHCLGGKALFIAAPKRQDLLSTCKLTDADTRLTVAFFNAMTGSRTGQTAYRPSTSGPARLVRQPQHSIKGVSHEGTLRLALILPRGRRPFIMEDQVFEKEERREPIRPLERDSCSCARFVRIGREPHLLWFPNRDQQCFIAFVGGVPRSARCGARSQHERLRRRDSLRLRHLPLWRVLLRV